MSAAETPGESRFERWRRTAEVAAASAGETRARVIRELATALAVLVRRVRIPLLIVGLLPLTPALVLALEGLAVGGDGGVFFLVLALVGAAPGLWVLWRRRRLMRAVDPEDELAAELAQAYDVAGAWAKAGDALRQVRAAGPGLRGAGRAARGVWAGVRLTRELFDRFTDLPRVAPFLPPSLQFTGYLCLASLVSAVVLIALAVAGFGVVLVT